MASQKRDMQTTQNKITTEEILAKLQDDKDHTKFFYLYVSTSEDDTTYHDEEGRGIKKRKLSNTTATSHSGNLECSSSREDNDVGETRQVDNTESVADNNPGVQNDQKAIDNARSKAMKRVHDTIQTEVLYPQKWKKVCDKDWKPTYRALYFKTIEKEQNEKESGKEGDIQHMQ